MNVDRPSDEVVAAVATSNLISIRKTHDMVDSLKKFRTFFSTAGLDKKLSRRQQSILIANRAFLLVHTGKVSGFLCVRLVLLSTILIVG